MTALTSSPEHRALIVLRHPRALALVLLLGLAACHSGPIGTGKQRPEITYHAIEEGEIWFKNSVIQLRFDNEMYCRVFFRRENQLRSINDIPIDPAIARPTHFLEVDGKIVKDFQVDYRNVGVSDLRTPLGAGKRLYLLGYAKTEGGDKIEKSLNVEFYTDCPDMAIVSVAYRNFENSRTISVTRLFNNFYRLDAARAHAGAPRFAFWRFHGLAGKEGSGAAQILSPDFSQAYSTRLTSPGSEERLPFIDLWTEEMGMAIGDLSAPPAAEVLPIQVASDHRVEICMEVHTPVQIPANGTLALPKSFLMVHRGDYVAAWQQYKNVRKRLE
jgi:alpha-galactosidase